MSTVPDFLSKRGITEVTDNVPEGFHVQAPTLEFVTLFRDELLERLADNPKPSSDDSDPGK